MFKFNTLSEISKKNKLTKHQKKTKPTRRTELSTRYESWRECKRMGQE